MKVNLTSLPLIWLVPIAQAYPDTDPPQTYGIKLMRYKNGNQDVSRNSDIRDNDVLGYEETDGIQQVDDQFYDMETFSNKTENQQYLPTPTTSVSVPVQALRVIPPEDDELNEYGQKCIRRQVMRYVTEYQEEMGCEVTYEPVCHTYKEVPKEICTVKRINPVRRQKPYIQTFCFKPEEGDFSDAPWKMVRHVPQGSKWHKARDQLKGTEVYGNPQDMTKEWSVDWSQEEFTEFLISSGDFKNWAIIRKSDLVGDDGEKWYSNVDVTIQVSSFSCIPYKARMYRRKGHAEDPWITIRHYGTAKSVVYGSGHHGSNADLLSTSGGMNVYIRNNPDYNINNENVLKNPNCNPANLIGDFEQI